MPATKTVKVDVKKLRKDIERSDLTFAALGQEMSRGYNYISSVLKRGKATPNALRWLEKKFNRAEHYYEIQEPVDDTANAESEPSDLELLFITLINNTTRIINQNEQIIRGLNEIYKVSHSNCISFEGWRHSWTDHNDKLFQKLNCTTGKVAECLNALKGGK